MIPNITTAKTTWALASASQTARRGHRLHASAPARPPAPLELANIRRSLILMEDTIIFSLIERSQYALNSPVYKPGATVQQYLKDSGRQLSLLEYLLMETVRSGAGNFTQSPTHSIPLNTPKTYVGARTRQDQAVQLV